METEAVIAILRRCTADWELVGSEVIDYEVAGISDTERRKHVGDLIRFVREYVLLDPELIDRARTLHTNGIDTFDSLHLACAERAAAVFLTTDDVLIKHIKMQADKIPIKTANPVQWFMEVTNDGSKDA